ncbi:MAG: hypothetical protein AAGJ94_05265 [Pseudomonadota bacterium]
MNVAQGCLLLTLAFVFGVANAAADPVTPSPHTNMTLAQQVPAPPVQNAFTPPPAKEGFSYPDCYCTDSNGSRVELGELACLTVGRRQVLALCGMSQNNPAWRTQQEGCPSV